jgi:hypothetical protein
MLFGISSIWRCIYRAFSVALYLVFLIPLSILVESSAALAIVIECQLDLKVCDQFAHMSKSDKEVREVSKVDLVFTLILISATE